MIKSTRANIREVGPDDFLALTAFFMHNDDSGTARQFHPFPMTSETADSICNRRRKDRYYVAISDEKVVGLTMLRGLDEGFAIPSFGIIVDRTSRGRGLGSELTRYTIDAARRLGCGRVRLTVYASNANAITVYSAFGFQEAGRSSVLVGGEIDEKIVMFLDLKGLE